MKMPVKWHEECLVNMRKSLQRDRDAFERMRARLEREESEVSLYESQVDRAKREGRESFDSERFNVPRKKSQA